MRAEQLGGGGDTPRLDSPGWTDQRIAAVQAIAAVAQMDVQRCTSLLAKAGPDEVRQAGWAALLGRLGREGLAGHRSVSGRQLKNIDIQRLARSLSGLPSRACEDTASRLLGPIALLVSGRDTGDASAPWQGCHLTTHSEAALAALVFDKTTPEALRLPPGGGMALALERLVAEEAPGRRLRELCEQSRLAPFVAGGAERELILMRLATAWLRACWVLAPASRLAGDVLDFCEGLHGDKARGNVILVALFGVGDDASRAAGAGAARVQQQTPGGDAPPSGFMAWPKAMAMLEESVDAIADGPEQLSAGAALGLVALVRVVADPLTQWPVADARGERIAALARRLEGMQQPGVAEYLAAPVAQAVAQWRLAGGVGGERRRKRA